MWFELPPRMRMLPAETPVQLRESQQLRLGRLYPRSSYKEGTQTVLVPKPTTARILLIVLLVGSVVGLKAVS